MLWDRCKPLVQQEHQTVVISLHREAAAPEVRAPMADCVDETDELPFVGGEGAVTGSHQAAEVGDGVFVLDEHRPKAMG